MAGTVVVFDFDETIINCDSDSLIADGLGLSKFFRELLKSMSWNAASIILMHELKSKGRSINEVAKILKRAPLSPHIAAAIKSAYAFGCELKIVSDSNTVYIQTVLKHHGLLSCFSEVVTNPSHVDQQGNLRISPYHDFTYSSHGCSLCPPNMCKGTIVEKIKESAIREGKKRIIYVGDGKGDYCPSLKLREQDYVMPRKNYPFWKLISNNIDALRAKIHEWADAEELEIVLLRLISRSALTDGTWQPLLSIDQNLPIMPLSSL